MSFWPEPDTRVPGSTATYSYDYIMHRIPGMDESIRPYWQNVANSIGPGGSVQAVALGSQGRSPVSGDWEVYQDPMAGYYESMSAMMEAQAMQQANYLAQMSALQQEQMEAMQAAAEATQIESGKDAQDYYQANAADVRSKQKRRLGLYSTYRRYGDNSGSTKATKLGG